MIARILVPAMLLSSGLAAWQETAGPTFDVASVREAKDTGGGSVGMHNGRYLAKNWPLHTLISSAYGVRPNLVSGLPGWAEATHYDIEAKVDEAEAAAMQKMSPQESAITQQKLLRALLEERFHLQVRVIEKELPEYDLVIAKGGLKMKEADAKGDYSTGLQGPKGPLGAGAMRVGSGTMMCQACPFSNFFVNIERQFDRTVVDKTGITGKYDFELHWTPDSMLGPESQWPGLFTALEEQLGLKINSTKGMTPTLVVDRIERPTQN